MSRLPMSKKQHWNLLNEKPNTSKFQKTEQQVVDSLEALLGFRIDGEVDDINSRSYGVGFDLTGLMQDNPDHRVRKIFPSHSNNLSYWVTASKIPSNNEEKTLEIFENDFSFTHRFRIDRSILPIVLERFRSNGVFVDTVSDSQEPTMKKISTSESYIENISSTMEAWDDLEKPMN